MPGYKGIKAGVQGLVPEYEGISVRGTKVLVPGYEGISAGVQGY